MGAVLQHKARPKRPNILRFSLELRWLTQIAWQSHYTWAEINCFRLLSPCWIIDTGSIWTKLVKVGNEKTGRNRLQTATTKLEPQFTLIYNLKKAFIGIRLQPLSNHFQIISNAKNMTTGKSWRVIQRGRGNFCRITNNDSAPTFATMKFTVVT